MYSPNAVSLKLKKKKPFLSYLCLYWSESVHSMQFIVASVTGEGERLHQSSCYHDHLSQIVHQMLVAGRLMTNNIGWGDRNVTPVINYLNHC